MSEYDANKYLAESAGTRDPKPIKTFPLARFAVVLLGFAIVAVAWRLLL